MILKEIRAIIELDKFLEIKNYLKFNKNIEIIKESSYEDSYFDTSLQNFKENEMEIVKRTSVNGLVGSDLFFFKKENNNIWSKEIDSFSFSKLNNLTKIYFEDSLELFEISKYFCQISKFHYADLHFELEEISLDDNKIYIFTISQKGDMDLQKISKYFEMFNVSPLKISKLGYYFNFKKKLKYNFIDDDLPYTDEYIVVVEGKNDTAALRKYFPEIMIFETGGLSISKERIFTLKKMSENYGKKILILTDPDTPGEIIRKRISDEIENCHHKYIYNKNIDGHRKKKIGVEALDEKAIREIFENVKTKKSDDSFVKYDMNKLIELGVCFDKEKRRLFCEDLGIAFGNNKKVLKQINEFKIKL